jgi:class 3 adenylate cyclase
LFVVESIELATILLTDLVGSTRLATAVGPARADQLRDDHFALLHEAIDPSGGREFKNTGDGLFVAFSSASAAVGCAVLMQQLFERRYRGSEQRLRVRIGVGTGESTVKDGDYFGMPSIEAARLCDKAPADGILVSPMTRMAAGRVDGARFESVGELELKGIPEPVEAFTVLWEPLDPERASDGVGRWPLPEALRAVPRIAYVGRESERGLLEVARGEARSGSRRVVLLSGEPGIGKTRLAAYSALGANADGFAVCWGACSEDLAAPYEPWIAVCSQIVDHAAEDVLSDYVRAHGGEIARLAGNLAIRLPDAPGPQTSDPETERFLLFKAVVELLRVVAGSVPLCVVLDDFQWADGQSVALLKHVTRNLERGALELLVTYRDSDLTADHRLTGVLADLRRLDGVERVALHGLESDDVRAMTEAAAGHELDGDGVALASEIAAETDGNPFFVGEILRNLSESGMVVFDEQRGRWAIDRSSGVALPESVREVIERRVAVLGAATRETLRSAAVIGRSFDLDVLSRLVELGEGELLEHLEAAVQASLLDESTDSLGRFSFAHALINHTLYEGLGGTRRARMHLRVAEALEDIYGTESDEQVAELALHWRLATVSVDKSKAAGYALRAGRQALERLAPSEAARQFSEALELLGTGDTPERCEALIGLGEAQRQSGEPAYRETLLEAARIASALADAGLAARAALAGNRVTAGSVLGEVDQERMRAISRALELDDPPNPARRARLLSLQAQELIWDPDFERRRALADEAVVLARRAGDARTLAEVLHDAFYAYWSAETLASAEALSKELSACANSLRDPGLRFWAQNDEFIVDIERGEFARADAGLERMKAIADELGQPTVNWFVTFAAAALELMRVDLADAERSMEHAFAIGQVAEEANAVFIYGAQLVYVRHYQGRTEEVVPMLEQSVSAYPDVAAWKAALAELLGWLGRHAESVAILERAASDRFEHVLPGPARSTAIVLYADAAVQTDNAAAASILYELIGPWAGQIVWNNAQSYGHARLWQGLLAGVLGEYQRAEEHLSFACEFHQANGLPLWTARGELGWAELLSARGDGAGAREHAARALELSREHGYGLFEPRAAALVETRSPAEA